MLPLKGLIVNTPGIITSKDNILYNSDMSFMLPMVNAIFNKTGKMVDVDILEDYYAEIISFLDDAKIRLQSIHVEIVLAAMTRNAENPKLMANETPNEAYKIHSLSSAILNGSGAFDSLCFERIKDSLANPQLYLTRENSSIGFEELFYPTKEE